MTYRVVISTEARNALDDQIQADISKIKTDTQELKIGQLGIREEIHSLSGRVLGVERSNADLDRRLARIEKRLDLVDA